MTRRALNIRRGLMRTTAVFILAWSAFWGWQYFEADKHRRAAISLANTVNEIRLRRFGDIPGGADYDPYYRELWRTENDAYSERDRQAERQDAAATNGILGVLIYCVALAAGSWLIRGFIKQSAAVDAEFPSENDTERSATGALDGGPRRSRFGFASKSFRSLPLILLLAAATLWTGYSYMTGIRWERTRDVAASTIILCLMIGAANFAYRVVIKSRD